jgi:hypothetical protein
MKETLPRHETFTIYARRVFFHTFFKTTKSVFLMSFNQHHRVINVSLIEIKIITKYYTVFSSLFLVAYAYFSPQITLKKKYTKIFDQLSDIAADGKELFHIDKFFYDRRQENIFGKRKIIWLFSFFDKFYFIF